MPELYTVSFTTKTLVSKYDEKGNLLTKEALGRPIVIEALPLVTAKKYAKCENFKMERYVFQDQKRRGKGGSIMDDDSMVGNGTKRVNRSAKPGGAQKPKSAPRKSETTSQRAARTGDLSGAING